MTKLPAEHAWLLSKPGSQSNPPLELVGTKPEYGLASNTLWESHLRTMQILLSWLAGWQGKPAKICHACDHAVISMQTWYECPQGLKKPNRT